MLVLHCVTAVISLPPHGTSVNGNKYHFMVFTLFMYYCATHWKYYAFYSTTFNQQLHLLVTLHIRFFIT